MTWFSKSVQPQRYTKSSTNKNSSIPVLIDCIEKYLKNCIRHSPKSSSEQGGGAALQGGSVAAQKL
jgi:adenosyl cobinamide kinase/adenosyl cobinamide phosphate guanylyltransferase